MQHLRCSDQDAYEPPKQLFTRSLLSRGAVEVVEGPARICHNDRKSLFVEALTSAETPHLGCFQGTALHTCRSLEHENAAVECCRWLRNSRCATLNDQERIKTSFQKCTTPWSLMRCLGWSHNILIPLLWLYVSIESALDLHQLI